MIHLVTLFPEFIYRRIPVQHLRREMVLPGAFHKEQSHSGLSFFSSLQTSAFAVLQHEIDIMNRRVGEVVEEGKTSPVDWLRKNPDVATLVSKGHRVAKISVKAIVHLGFAEEEFIGPELNGHINLLGSSEKFQILAPDFVELFDTGEARILTAEECLAQ